MNENKTKAKEKDLPAQAEGEPIAKTEQTAIKAESIEGVPVIRSRKVVEEMFPDKKFKDDDEYESFLAEFIRNSSKQMADNNAANEIIAEILEDYPELALIVEDLKEGVPFNVALAKHIDPEDLVATEGDEEYRDYMQAVEERRQRFKDSQSRIKERESNMNSSNETFEKFISSTGWDKAKATDFTSWIESFLQDFARGVISEQMLNKLKKGFEFEEVIEEAIEEAKVEARNEKIETTRNKKEVDGDGLATGSSGGNIATPKERQRKIFDFDALKENSL